MSDNSDNSDKTDKTVQTDTKQPAKQPSRLNKQGDHRGTKAVNKHNFANDPSLASAAGKKHRTDKSSISLAITKSSSITQGRTKRITPEVQEEIRSKLLGIEKNGHSYLTNFISSFLNEAKTDPNSQPARFLANAIFKDELLTTLDDTLNRQMNRDRSFAEYQIRKTLYDKQQEVYDNDTDKVIQIICSRRSGKTELMGRLLVKRLLRPNQHVVYINRTFDAAQRQIRRPFEAAMEAVGDSLKIVNGSVGGGMVNFDNGSWLLVVGNNNISDIDKVRGDALSLVVLDEHAHMRHVKPLVQETLQPAMMDYADSQLILIGTPPRTKHSFATELWHNDGIRHYHWTFMDNPFIPNRDKVIEQVCQLNGVAPDSMFIKREYFGDMEAYDDDAMFIKRVTQGEADPKGTYWQGYVCVDWGFEDKAAVVACLADKVNKRLYVVSDWSAARKGISEISEEVYTKVNMLKSFSTAMEPIIITDNNEKSAAFDLTRVYHLDNVRTAYKYNKDFALDQLSEWFSSGTVVVSANAKAVREDAEGMVWKRDEETDKIVHELDDDEYHGNAMFALLYGSRQFAYDVMGIIETNKPAKPLTTGRELAAAAEEKAGTNVALLQTEEPISAKGSSREGRSYMR